MQLSFIQYIQQGVIASSLFELGVLGVKNIEDPCLKVNIILEIVIVTSFYNLTEKLKQHKYYILSEDVLK